jgi:hypothetical protein
MTHNTPMVITGLIGVLITAVFLVKSFAYEAKHPSPYEASGASFGWVLKTFAFLFGAALWLTVLIVLWMVFPILAVGFFFVSVLIYMWSVDL